MHRTKALIGHRLVLPLSPPPLLSFLPIGIHTRGFRCADIAMCDGKISRNYRDRYLLSLVLQECKMIRLRIQREISHLPLMMKLIRARYPAILIPSNI